ncbi:methyl-accepting chemotaxis protein [Actinomycetes bacterium NPDC127524]
MKNSEEKNKVKWRVSIKVKWMLFICAAVLIAIAVTAFTMNSTVAKIFEKDNTASNKISSKNASGQIQAELKNYEGSLEQLSSLVSIELDGRKSVTGVEKNLETVKKQNGNLLSVYYMDGHSGKLHIFPKMAFDKDVRETRTYKDLTASPKTQWMDVYRDSVTGKIMTSVVTPVFTKGVMTGALGYDIDLSSIGEIRKSIEHYSKSKLIILDSQGFVVSSFMKHADGKNMNPAKSHAVEGVSDLVANNSQFKKKFSWVGDLYQGKVSSQSLDYSGQPYTGEAANIKKLNWKVLSFTPDEFLQSKLKDIADRAIISAIIGLLIGACCAIFLAGKLNKIIGALQAVLAKTSKGDLVTGMSVSSNDEIGDLSNSYNIMLAKLRQLIETVKGNVDRVNTAVKGLTVIAAENNTSITEVSSAIEEIAGGASNQSIHVETGADATQKLSIEIDGLLQQSSSSQTKLGKASDEAKAGMEQVDQLKDSYSQLEEAFRKVTSMIASLADKSKNIANVTQAISNIAEQTNLLSLNASIEAARAGEHGKGFAVVANEVRHLADDSKVAALNIQEIINSVLIDTDKLVKTMEETNEISKEQHGAVSSVSKSMTEMDGSMKEVIAAMNLEAKSIENIRGQKENVLQTMEEISAISQQTAASAEEIAASMEEQAASSNDLAQYTVNLAELLENLENAMIEFKIHS